MDSRELIRLARQIYFKYLSDTPAGPEPMGVVVDLDHADGRVVFDSPVLLPEEDFVGFELIRSRGSRSRNRCRT